MAFNYRQINYRVMTDTVKSYQTIPQLAAAIRSSIQKQYMVSEEENVVVLEDEDAKTSYIVSGKRSFEAAKGYPGKKVAVLNYANNHSIGGAPFSAGAQEESLCRCSTLYPCLQAMDVPFYQKHQQDYMAGKLTIMGNDDLIYTPDVVVFKTDERTEPIEPKMMPESDWYKVNVITCAAPEFRGKPQTYPDGYRELISKRIKRILDVAAKEQNEVLILGAWGCGAYGNSLDVVANVFMELLPNYGFEIVEFAMSKGDGQDTPFAAEIRKMESSDEDTQYINQPNSVTPKDFVKLINPDMPEDQKQRIIAKIEQHQKDMLIETDDERRFRALLTATGREGIDDVLDKLKKGDFFTAPGSVVHHSNWKGGLVNHSLKVYDEAMKLRAEFLAQNPGHESEVPADSVTIAALLHDVCKFDQYTIGLDGKPHHKKPYISLGGHGFKSVVLLQYWGLKLWPIEIVAIRWHMGKADIKSDDELKVYQDALNLEIIKLIVKADYNATHNNQ